MPLLVVGNLVAGGAGKTPAVLAVVDLLRQRERALPTQAVFASGDSVVITDGPFAGIEAIYQTTDAERRSMILLSMLNKPVSMRIEPGQLGKCG